MNAEARPKRSKQLGHYVTRAVCNALGNMTSASESFKEWMM